ncbi:unnamed protein product [Mycena citricolor]|uniref:Uncharacterized protein n=1 Tax=Mycena citricolor TaxID=2018698 RepID=A0AAD2JX03_9AGAR|nr:unnamed protein product [Mycena citricolor]
MVTTRSQEASESQVEDPIARAPDNLSRASAPGTSILKPAAPSDSENIDPNVESHEVDRKTVQIEPSVVKVEEIPAQSSA